jgi:hypothetical protein
VNLEAQGSVGEVFGEVGVDVERLSVRELRRIISESGLSSTDCIDKSDLRARAREALQAEQAKRTVEAQFLPDGQGIAEELD